MAGSDNSIKGAQTTFKLRDEYFELYVHVPFCVKKCRYCDFASFPDLLLSAPSYIESVLLEAEARSNLVDKPVGTIYIGGGTPSLLSPETLKRLCHGLRERFLLGNHVEWSVEANPGTLTEEWLKTARNSGINRLSIGAQSFQDHLLTTLGRIHRKEDIIRSVRMARDADFENISLDLMFGLPGQTPEDWKFTLEEALRLRPFHISAYGLIPEEGTPLFNDLKTKKLSLPEPETEREMYEILKETLFNHGYLQYEISNFALPGYECRHNIGYWRQIPYLGLGLSAASMHSIKTGLGGTSYIRETNPSDMYSYLRLVRQNSESENPSDKRIPVVHRERAEIQRDETRFETLMLGLRMNEGVSDRFFEDLHNATIMSLWGPKLSRLQSEGLISHKESRWFLTSKGMDLQNAVLLELMD